MHEFLLCQVVTIASDDNECVELADDNAVGKRSTPEQREKLGLGKGAKGSKTPPVEPTNAMQQVEVHIYVFSSTSKPVDGYLNFIYFVSILC